MGLAFQVTTPDHAFVAGYADKVIDTFWDRFGVRYSMRDRPRYWSEEIGSKWLLELQEALEERLGSGTLPHLEACDSWATVYLPIEDLEPEQLTIGGEPLIVASLPGLRKELVRVAEALEQPTPTEHEALEQAAKGYQADDGLADRDHAIQAYLHLAMTVEHAAEQTLPLWVLR